MVKKILDFLRPMFNRKPPSVHITMEFDGNGILTGFEYTNNVNPTFVASIPFSDEAADALDDCDLTEEQKAEVIARVHHSKIAEFIRALENGSTYDELMRWYGDGHCDDDIV